MKLTLKALGIAVILFALAGCASQSDNIAAAPIMTSSVTPVCLSSQLIVIDGLGGVAMGHFGLDSSAFKNISKSTCTLQGFPNFQMLERSGKLIATQVIGGTSYTVHYQSEDIVTLLPGNEAMFDLGFDNATGYGRSLCPTSAKVKVTPPGNTESITVPWKFQPYGGGTIANLRCGEITTSPVYWPIRA